MEKRPFFRADMAGLGKYHTGGFGRIGVYRVQKNILLLVFVFQWILFHKVTNTVTLGYIGKSVI